MVDINSVVDNIMITYHTENKVTCNLKIYVTKDKINILYELLNNIDNNNNFKMETYYSLFNFIVDNVILLYIDNKNSNDIFNTLLLTKLSILNKGQYMLNKLENNISFQLFKKTEINDYVKLSCRYGTFITFLYWLNKIDDIKNLNQQTLEIIMITSIMNSDDRIYKYLIDKTLIINKLFFQKTIIIKELLSNLANSGIPSKYILKRIKLLSTKISLNPYFHFMVHIFNDSKVIYELHKYYYIIPHTFQSLSSLSKSIIHNYKVENFDKILSILNTDEEKNMLYIICIISSNHFIKNYDFNHLILEKIIIDNYSQIIRIINWDFIIIDIHPLSKEIIKILIKNNLIHKFLDNSSIIFINKKIIFFTRFYMVPYIISKENFEYIKPLIRINKVLHKLRILAKQKAKSKVINHNIKMYDILREIKTYSPNENRPILKNGSIHYQYQKQKFTNLPPRHLLPGEIHQYHNFLIREKADGILIDNLPLGIFPSHDLVGNYQVKAEYIEELDLYLIFDIDIPNTTLIDRYNILRNAHTYTCNSKLETINKLDDFFEILKMERQTIIRFLKENKINSIKWYPKFACLVNDSELNDQLIQEIILSENFYYEPYICDGLILSPIDGSREIKIKPLSLMTIDLLYNPNNSNNNNANNNANNGKWVTRDQNDVSHLIIKSDIQKNGKIYRCKPILNGKHLSFSVDSYRYDKKKPNSNTVVNSICNIIKYDWSQDISRNKNKELYYYDTPKKLSSPSLILMINSHRNILFEQIYKLEPSMNQKWLDLGCGNGKLIPLIKKYNPKLYLGLDIDVTPLTKCLKYHDENQDVYLFNKCNLAKQWDDTNGQWFSDYKKYDYVIANYSIMHFFTDLFWEQLDHMVSIGTRFIFNIVSQSLKSLEWSENNSFLKIINDQVIYKFEWIHDDIKTEPFISEEKIFSQLEKSKWKLISKVTINSSHDLSNFYTWWMIEKI